MARAAPAGDTPPMLLCAATDLSESGLVAVRHALEWARVAGARLRLLHVIPDPELAPAFSDDVGGDVERARATLQRLAEEHEVACDVDVRAAEDVAAEILRATGDCDYVFVGSQGKSAFERFRLGSVATAVMRQSGVPVVCCPPPAAAR